MRKSASAMLLAKNGQLNQKNPFAGTQPLFDRFPAIQHHLTILTAGSAHEAIGVSCMVKAVVRKDDDVHTQLGRLISDARYLFDLKEALISAKTEGALDELKHSIESMVGAIATLIKKIKGKIKGVEEEKAINMRAEYGVVLCNAVKGMCTRKVSPEMCPISNKDIMKIISDNVSVSGINVDYSVETWDGIHANPFFFSLIVSNMLSNAKRALEGKPPELKISIDKTDSMHITTFEDRGSGMTENQKELLNSGKGTSTRQGKGHGEGFKYCQQLAQSMGGNLLVEKTEIGKGTTIVLTLPLIEMELPRTVELPLVANLN
ncbi:ATP-binding protein [Candidatus Micrarchaeota archaeon]|nr:ATP-binding protein [Candidatus Micrarchaeota archaeon]